MNDRLHRTDENADDPTPGTTASGARSAQGLPLPVRIAITLALLGALAALVIHQSF